MTEILLIGILNPPSTLLKINIMEHNNIIMKAWFRCFSFSIGRFFGSMLIFPGGIGLMNYHPGFAIIT